MQMRQPCRSRLGERAHWDICGRWYSNKHRCHKGSTKAAQNATRSQLHHCWRSAGWLKAEVLPESYAPPSSSVSIFEASNDSLVADYVQRARDANTHLLPWSSPLACYSSPDKNQPNKPLLLVILSDSLGLYWIKMKEVWRKCYDHSV